MFVCGVNVKPYVKGTQLVSNASCTTNCLEMCIRDRYPDDKHNPVVSADLHSSDYIHRSRTQRTNSFRSEQLFGHNIEHLFLLRTIQRLSLIHI